MPTANSQPIPDDAPDSAEESRLAAQRPHPRTRDPIFSGCGLGQDIGPIDDMVVILALVSSSTNGQNSTDTAVDPRSRSA